MTITATYNGAVKTATLTVNPPAALAGLTVTPAVVIFGSNATGTVTLTSAAPAGGTVIALAATNYFEFYVPASVTVPAGATTAKFPVGTSLYSSTTTITATYNGVTKAANLTSVDPTVVALTCNPNPVFAGNTTICTVTLNGIMPAPTPVFILSDQPFFAPASGTVTVPTGANGINFSINTTVGLVNSGSVKMATRSPIYSEILLRERRAFTCRRAEDVDRLLEDQFDVPVAHGNELRKFQAARRSYR